MSRRKKFAFITWIGPSVSPLKKAKVSTDKAFVKEIVRVSIYLLCTQVCEGCRITFFPHAPTFTDTQDFGKEFLADEKGELKYEKILSTLEKASGAAYGTGR